MSDNMISDRVIVMHLGAREPLRLRISVAEVDTCDPDPASGSCQDAAARVQRAIAQWQAAVDGDDEDVDSLDEMSSAAADLADLVLTQALGGESRSVPPPRRWMIQNLIIGETREYLASDADEAVRAHLDEIEAHLLVWPAEN